MIAMKEYANRRKAIMKKIGGKGIFILPSAPECTRNGDASYPFRQHSDFYYLTGFEEPEAVLVLAPKRKEGEYLLFSRSRDADAERWNGARAGQEGAKNNYGADQAFPIHEWELLLPELLMGREDIHYPLGIHGEFDKIVMRGLNKIRSKIRAGAQSPLSFIDITPTLHEMRLFKSKAEIAVMQKAVDITGKAHVRAMQACHPGLYEYQLEAEIMHEFIRHGARHPAYGTIIGSGENTCVLHYVRNQNQIANGDLVLIDAGAEYQNYAADITRTFPANGRFSAEQAAVYEIVLAAQLAAIKSIKPGASWAQAQSIIVSILTQGLRDLGILKGNLQHLIEKRAYLPFYMHKSGHWLGLDVHDVGRYQLGEKWRPLQTGMALTVEPGIYISAHIPGVAKRWHNIGVRIEDDVIVTPKGCEILSAHIPKTINDIETIMAK